MSLAVRRLAAGVLLVGALAWALAWLLAGGQAAPAESAVRAVADVAAAAVLGLAVLPVLDEPRHRTELVRAAGGPLAVASVAALPVTGYGRLLLAKIVVAAALVLLAWFNRTRWLPAARGHRVLAEQSRHNAHREVVLMVVATDPGRRARRCGLSRPSAKAGLA